jgi:hypothetical protein
VPLSQNVWYRPVGGARGRTRSTIFLRVVRSLDYAFLRFSSLNVASHGLRALYDRRAAKQYTAKETSLFYGKNDRVEETIAATLESTELDNVLAGEFRDKALIGWF